MAQEDGDDELARLRTRVANLERLASRVAHELATPVTTAHGFATLLLDTATLPSDVRTVLERIERATGSALDMLSSRADDAGGAPEVLVLRDIVCDVVAAVVGEDVPCGEGLPHDARVFADRAAVRTALGLVVGLLVDHATASGSDPGGLRVRMASPRSGAHAVQLSVAAPPLPSDVRTAASGGSAGGHADAAPEGDAAGRAARARALLGATGGKLWLEEAAATPGRASVLVELPRDVG